MLEQTTKIPYQITGFYHSSYLDIQAFIREYSRLESHGINSEDKKERIIFKILELLPANPSELEAKERLTRLYNFCIKSPLDICKNLKFRISKILSHDKKISWMKNPYRRNLIIEDLRKDDIVRYLILTNKPKYLEIRDKLIAAKRWNRYYLEKEIKKQC